MIFIFLNYVFQSTFLESAPRSLPFSINWSLGDYFLFFWWDLMCLLPGHLVIKPRLETCTCCLFSLDGQTALGRVLVAASGSTTKATQKVFESKRWILTHRLSQCPDLSLTTQLTLNLTWMTNPWYPSGSLVVLYRRGFLELQFAADEFKILWLPVCFKLCTLLNILQIIILTLVRSHLADRAVNFCPRNHYWWRSTVISYWKPQPEINQSINRNVIINRFIAWLSCSFYTVYNFNILIPSDLNL